jgi:hypothetical protein
VASNYPGSLDSFDTIASDKKTSDSVGGRTHRDMHNDLGDAIESVQGELGTDPSGSYATVKARFEAIEGSTLPQVDAKGDLIVGTADNTYDNLGVGTNDTVLLAASGETKGVKWAQVPTAAIQDGAVTSAKLATSGRFVFPTGAANGFGFTSGASHLSGTGSPEGVVTATPGSTWLQTDATTDVKGWIRWVKATGTGNTGWVAGAEADTGLRDVSALIPAAHLALNPNAKMTLRRVGPLVTATYYSGTSPTATGLQTLSDGTTIPTGFRWTKTADNRVLSGALVDAASGAGTTVSLYMYGAGFLTSGSQVSGTRYQGSISWTTDDAWPPSLPGSAA